MRNESTTGGWCTRHPSRSLYTTVQIFPCTITGDNIGNNLRLVVLNSLEIYFGVVEVKFV